MGKAHKLRPSERRAALALERLLLEAHCTVAWEKGPGQHLVPDLIFTVDGERWAVEETQLDQYIGDRGTPRSARALLADLEKLCQGIAKEAEAYPRAGYWMSAFAPVRPPLSEIRQRALAYIRSGETGKRVLDKEGSVTIRARPTHQDRPLAYSVQLHACVPAADRCSFHGDVALNVERAIDRVLGEKRPRLRPLKGFARKVLVISKAYLHAELREVARAIAAKGLTADDLDAVLFLFLEDDVYVSDAGDVVNTAGDIHVVASPGRWGLPMASTPGDR